MPKQVFLDYHILVLMSEITSIDQLDLSKYYTYQDYLTWKFNERVELFLGKVFKMSPAPNVNHQLISGNLYREFANHLYAQNCKVFSAPFDVRLPISKKEGAKDTVVQPDIVVVCDLSILDEQGCNGSPDIVIEILSPGNSSKEMKDKFELYEASKINEYWMVDPGNEDVIIYTLNAHSEYIGSKRHISGQTITSTILPELKIEVNEIFRK